MRGAKVILALAGCAITPSAFAADSSFDAALRQAQSGDCAAAVQTLTPAIQATPKPAASAYALVSYCHEQMQRPADAERILRQGLSVHPGDPVLERSLGQLLMRQQFDSAEAGQLLEHAATKAPADPEVRHYYAQWAYMNARERICVTQEQAALRLPGLNDAALLQMNTLLGMCDGKIEDSAGAKAAFQRANVVNLRQKTYDPVAAWQYMQFLGRFGQDAEVQSIVDQILAHVPDFGPALLEHAKYFDRSGQAEKAIEEARLVLQGAGDDFNVERAAHAILARSFAALGRNAEAAQEQAWIEAHPNPETPK